MTFRPLLALTACLLVGGCTSGSSADAPAPATTAIVVTGSEPATAAPMPSDSVPDGWRTVEGPEFAIGVPADWIAIHIDGTSLTADQAGTPIPDSVQQLGLAAGLQGGRLLAVADESAAVNLMVNALGPDDAPAGATASDSMRAQLAESGVEDLHMEVVELPAGPAVLSTYRRLAHDGQERSISSIYLPSPTGSWAMTLDAPAGDPAGALFGDIANTFTRI